MKEDSDKDFFWGKRHILDVCTNSIEYFVEQAMERGSENFTPEELADLRNQARQVLDAASEMIQRITLHGVTSPKRVVRFKREKDGTVVRQDGTEVCKVCGELISPGQMGWHYRAEHRLEDWLEKK